MDDEEIHHTISELIAEERKLREELGDGAITEQQEHRRLGALEVQLDQAWDLLRQRDARRAAHQDPDEAAPRTPETVEEYWQ